MQMTIEKNNESCTLKLEDKLSIYDVTQLHHELLSALETSSSVTVDWSSAVSCDSSIVQLLLAAAKTAQARHIHLELTEPGQDIAGFVNKLGFNWQDITQN